MRTWAALETGSLRHSAFEEVERYEDERTVTHVTLRLGDGIVFLGNPGPEYRGPRKLAETCEAARRMLETPYVVYGGGTHRGICH